MKKVLALILASLMVVSLAACNNPTPSSQPAGSSAAPETTAAPDTKTPETTATPVPEKEIEISYWDENATDQRTPYFEEMIRRFEAQNPGIKIKYTGLVQAESMNKYLQAIEGGTTPDTGGCKGDQQSQLVDSGHLVELDQYCANWDEFKDLTPSVMKVLADRGQGKLYLLPRSANVSIFWYNKTLFDKAGLGDPYVWTWTDWFNNVAAVNDPANEQYSLAFRGGKGGADSLYNYIYDYMGFSDQIGADGKSNINTKEAVEFVEKYVGLFGKYTSVDDLRQTYTDMTTEFDTGAAAIMFHNLGSFPDHVKNFPALNMEFGAAPLPKSDFTGKTVGWSGALASVMFDTCPEEEREAAFKWIAYLASEEGNGYFNQMIGQLPTNLRCANAPWLEEQFHIKMALKLTASDRYDEQPSLSYMPDWGSMLSGMEPRIQSLALTLNGDTEEEVKSAQQLLDEWEESINNMIDNYNKSQNK